MQNNLLRNLVFATGFILSAPVGADTFTINLDRSNVGMFLPDGNIYATVEIFDNAGGTTDASDLVAGSNVAFRVNVITTDDDSASLLTPGTNFGIQKFTFNDIGLSSPISFLLPSHWGYDSNRNGNGFGRFDHMVFTPKPPPGGVARMDPLIFGIVSLGSMITVNDFIEWTTTGRMSPFAAHIAGFLDVDTTYDGVITSAWFGVVPIPAAVWLFASALGVLGFLGRRHRLAKAG